MIPMNRQHSFLVQHPPADKARAIVVLFGWWGASTKHLNKYAELYQERGFQTIQVILDKNAILLIDTPAVENCALRTIDKTAKAIRHYSASSDKKIPVIFHAFSNGGAYVVERVEHFIRQEILKKELGDTDVSLVGDHLQGEIFDSAPAWPSTEGFDTAMSSVFTNALARFVVAKMAFFAFLLYSMWCMVRGVRQYRVSSLHTALFSHPSYLPLVLTIDVLTCCYVVDLLAQHDAYNSLYETGLYLLARGCHHGHGQVGGVNCGATKEERAHGGKVL
jgi:hypothetical protein